MKIQDLIQEYLGIVDLGMSNQYLPQSHNFIYMLHISVWLEIMVPVMTMKHYSKFVVNYLVQLLRLHKVRNTLYSTVHYITGSVYFYCTLYI